MKTGHAAMEEWDKTYRHHHMPQWLRKAIKKEGSMISKTVFGMSKGSFWDRNHEFNPCVPFDHYGSVLRDGLRVFINQPYERDDAAAEDFAKRVGCSLEVTAPGPWHPATVLYSFTPSAFTP
jgi:hypothetical protein